MKFPADLEKERDALAAVERTKWSKSCEKSQVNVITRLIETQAQNYEKKRLDRKYKIDNEVKIFSKNIKTTCSYEKLDNR